MQFAKSHSFHCIFTLISYFFRQAMEKECKWLTWEHMNNHKNDVWKGEIIYNNYENMFEICQVILISLCFHMDFVFLDVFRAGTRAQGPKMVANEVRSFELPGQLSHNSFAQHCPSFPDHKLVSCKPWRRDANGPPRNI